METIEVLIAEYLSAATAHNEPNDGSPSWIDRVNRAADRMLVASRQIGSAGPEGVSAFAQLVGADDPHLSIWAAHHMLDFMQPEPDLRERALSLIEQASNADTAPGHDEKLWLENWRAEQQDE